MRRSPLSAVGLAAICTVLISAPAWAQDNEHLLRFGGGYYATIGDANDVSDNGLGAWVSYERQLTEMYGLEFMAAYVDYDSFLDILGGISLTHLTGSLNFHMTPDANVDFYLAPTIGYAWLDWDHDPFPFLPGEWEDPSESGFAWGAAAGIDVPFGEGDWVFAASARFLTVVLEDSDFDNVVGHVGFGRRF